METETWIYRLAQEENSQKPVSFNEALELEEATEGFLLELKRLFTQAAKGFNHLKKAGHSIYIYRITNVREGFMLYRSGFRLLFYYEAPGKIRIQALKTNYGKEQKEILNIGLQAFRNNPLSAFKWNHEGHSGFADIQTLSSYYFKFLVRASRVDNLKKTQLLSKKENTSFL